MPSTLFHLGPALLLSIVLWRYLDFPTLLLGSLIVDIRTALVYLGIIDGALHGIFHTFLGGTLLAFLLIGVITPFRDYIGKIMTEKNLPQSSDDSTIVSAAFLSIYLHIFLDSILYTDMKPFLPLVENPLLDIAGAEIIYGICIFSGIIGISLIPWRTYSLKFEK